MGTSPKLLVQVGQRLRQRRSELGLTLAVVAARAEVSVSHLSTVEAGQRVPSLHVLARIVRALGLSLNEVLRQADGAGIEVGALDTDAGGITTISNPALRLQVVTLAAEPGETGDAPLGPARELFVLQHGGALQVEVDEELHVLQEGDSLHAVRPVRVRWAAIGGGRSFSIWVAAQPPTP